MITEAFAVVFSPFTIAVIFGGVALGIIFGVIPGLTATMAVALCLPISYGLPPIQGVALLLGLYIGGINGGLILSILLNIPGTPSSIATCFDGYPLTLKGEAGRALGVGIFYSFLSGVLAFSALIVLAPILARFALHFAPFEYFAVTVFSLTLIATLSGDNLLKGLLAGALGISFGLIGAAPIDSYRRYTFGISELNIGFSLLSILIGLYAINEIVQAAGNKYNEKNASMEIVAFKLKGFGISAKEFIQQLPNFIRSVLIGLGIGVLPGIGGNVTNLISYGAAKNASKYPEKFGTGVIDGVIAPETSNSAGVGGSLVPTLALGIPGDPVAAMVLAGLMIHGLVPGPMMFVTHGVFVWSVFISVMLANVAMLTLNYFGIRLWLRLLKIPKHILLAVVVSFCVVGTFGLNNRVFDVQAMFVFAAIGFGLSKLKMPLPPIIMGFILGPILETNLRRGLMMTNGDFMPFLTRPIPAVLLSVSFAAVILITVKRLQKKKQQNQ